MMVDFLYYNDEYGGGSMMDAAVFRHLERKAETYLRHALCEGADTQGYETEIKDCLCELVDELRSRESETGNGEKEVSSESNDGYSVTYVKSPDQETFESKLYGVIRRHLARTGLLYLGV